MDLSLLDRVRQSCRKVAHRAAWVEIDTSALAAYAASLAPERLLLPEMDPAIHYLGHGRDTVAYYLILDAVNFGSGYFPDIFGDRNSGYRAVAGALNRHFLAAGSIAPATLTTLSAEGCAELFGLDPSRLAVSELMSLYARALNHLGAFVCERFHGEYSHLVQAAEQTAERLVELLTEMPMFQDVELYGEMEVPFYKRAQLAVVDLFIAFGGAGEGAFGDIDRLTICADNLVPHVLRLDGVLRYREDLAARIDRGEPLPPGSPEEVEIRACSVHAAELILGELRDRGQKVNAMMLDNLLWHRGQEPLYRARPRHRTRSVFY